ncbi:MAG: tetratricopeptide repeat protein [Bacteroidales bacterium]|nr:tetratricopeptide repeat protein [Bacteroidales bacterium]
MRRLISVLLLLLLCLPSLAQNDRKDVRAGNRKFSKDKFKESEIDYRKAVLKDSTSVAGQYNLASSLYRQGDYDGAGVALGRVEESGRPEVYFNEGDVALQKKDYARAVEAFKNALLQTPDDLDAKENYIYAKKMLENQQQNNQNDQNQDQQNQDNQNQQDNQDQQNQDNQDDQDDRNDQQDDKDQSRQNNENQMSQQQAQQMLRAIQAKEKETQDKVNKEKAAALKSRQKEKNW